MNLRCLGPALGTMLLAVVFVFLCTPDVVNGAPSTGEHSSIIQEDGTESSHRVKRSEQCDFDKLYKEYGYQMETAETCATFVRKGIDSKRCTYCGQCNDPRVRNNTCAVMCGVCQEPKVKPPIYKSKFGCEHVGELQGEKHCAENNEDDKRLCKSRGGHSSCYHCEMTDYVGLFQCPIMCGVCEDPVNTGYPKRISNGDGGSEQEQPKTDKPKITPVPAGGPRVYEDEDYMDP